MPTDLQTSRQSSTVALWPGVAAVGRLLALAGVCLSLLTACPSGGGGFNTNLPANPNGPRLISNSGEIPGLPNGLGPFRRDQIVAYRPGERDFSVGYNLREPDGMAVSTVYFYTMDGPVPEFQRTLAGQFADAAASIKQAHPGATLVAQSRDTVTQGGEAIEGLSATYRYEEMFAGQRRLLASEVHVFMIGDHFVKFRNSYPWDQREAVAPQVAELIQRLDWSDPAAVTTYLLAR